MKKLVLVVVALLVIATVVTLVILRHRPEATPQAAALLPVTTVAFVDIPDFQTCRAKLAASPLARFWQDPAVQASLAKPVAALTGFTAGDPSPAWLTALSGGDALDLPQGEAFVAVTQVTIVPEQAPQCAFAAGVNLRGNKLATQATLKLVEYELRKFNPTATTETKKFLGRKYTLWKLAPGSEVAHAFFGSLLVVTTDEDLLRDMLARAAGKAATDAPPLAANVGYQDVLRQFPARQDLHAYLNVEHLINRFGLALMMAAPNNPYVQKIANIQAWGTGVTFGPTNITDVGITIYVKANPPTPPFRQAALAAAPADSTFYLAGQPNLANAYNTLLDLVKLTGNVNAGAVVAGVELTMAIAGVDPAKDLLAQLGPEVAGLGNWRPGAQVPDFALVAEVRDKPAFARKFARITAFLDKAAKAADATPYAGETLYVVRAGSGYAAPTYVLTDKFFILALTPDYARELVSQIQTGTVTLAAHSGNADTYCDLQQTLGGLYSLAGTNSLPLLGPLPAAETIARHVGTYRATTVDTPSSSITTAHSPLGKPVTLLVALLGGLGAAQTWLPQLQAAIPAWPTLSSGRATPPLPAGNRTAPSHIPEMQ